MTSAWLGEGVADSTIVDNVFYVPNECFEQKGFGMKGEGAVGVFVFA